ncbi:MAG: hypothetical protein R6U63_13800 [Longimicrobiales bacterium]
MQCEYEKDDGTRCGAHALRGERLCWSHHPDKAAERRAASSRGGKRSTRRTHDVEDIALDSAEDVRTLLEWTINSYRRGDIGTGTARALARLVSESRKTIETIDFEKRLAEVERVIEERERTTW